MIFEIPGSTNKSKLKVVFVEASNGSISKPNSNPVTPPAIPPAVI
jgi:hypothetical protein